MLVLLDTADSPRALSAPYPATLHVPYELVEHASWLIYARRRELNSPWRRLGCFKQDLLALAHVRKNETFAQLAAGVGVSTATAWRYVNETPDVLAAWALGLHEALAGLGDGDDDHMIVDGTLIPTGRIKADEPYYSICGASLVLPAGGSARSREQRFDSSFSSAVTVRTHRMFTTTGNSTGHPMGPAEFEVPCCARTGTR